MEILGPNGLCRQSGVPDLPEGRGKMSVAYDPAGAIIVCGGGERFWRPNDDCWQVSTYTRLYFSTLFDYYFGLFWVTDPRLDNVTDDHCHSAKKASGFWPGRRSAEKFKKGPF